MGRLMDTVGAALGLKPSDRVDLLNNQAGTQANNGVHPQTDCMSCRITGTTALGGCGLYSIFIVWRNPRNLEGNKLRNFRIAGVILATGAIMLAGCRWFNKGPFNHLENSPKS